MSILNEIIVKKCRNYKEASHIAIMRGNEVRYYISTKKGGKNELVSCLSSYSRKHLLLKSILFMFPLRVMLLMGIAKAVKLDLEKCIQSYSNEISNSYFSGSFWGYNILIGTYDSRQKIVIQCFNTKGPSIFFKIGNEHTKLHMQNEISFLKEKGKYSAFSIPEYISDTENYGLVVLVTKQFRGGKVKPVLDKDIYEIFLKLANSKVQYVENGTDMAFSHGDFTPWNMKKNNGLYIVFDWEYCGYRFYGFDLIHYVFQVETLLNGTEQGVALERAIELSKQYSVKLSHIDSKVLALGYLSEIDKIYGRKL